MRLNFREGKPTIQLMFLNFVLLSFFIILCLSPLSYYGLFIYLWGHLNREVLLSVFHEDIWFHHLMYYWVHTEKIFQNVERKSLEGFFFFKKCVFISLNLFRSVMSILRKDFIFWMIWYVLSALKAASVKGFKVWESLKSCQRALRCVCGLPNNFGGEFSQVWDQAQVIPLLIWVFSN